MLFILLPDAATANLSQLASGPEPALNSLVEQLNTTGFGVWSAMGGATAIAPPGIDHRTRVSCEVITPSCANYVDAQDALLRFCLSNPHELVACFDYTLYSGSATDEHFASTSETLTFAPGETEKEVAIDIRGLINNPTSEHPTASDPEEFWNGERGSAMYFAAISKTPCLQAIGRAWLCLYRLKTTVASILKRHTKMLVLHI